MADFPPSPTVTSNSSATVEVSEPSAATGPARFVFITGGVVSGLGKGITAASLGRLLRSRGLRVTAAKLDPYLNTDPGTLAPAEHGECYVTADGLEVDLDLGHYQRFIGVEIPGKASVTSGAVYQQVLSAERRGDYLGKTVQVVPHVTDAIKGRVLALDDGQVDVIIVEVGGTVGDIEGLPFLEAIRQLRRDLGRGRSASVHVTLLPEVGGELKTKPTQHSVAELRARGLAPDVLVVRAKDALDEHLRAKLARTCDVATEDVITARDASNLYEIPLNLHDEGFDARVCDALRLDTPAPELTGWADVVARIHRTTDEAASGAAAPLRVGLVGKYGEATDAYLSVVEAIKHAAWAAGAAPEVVPVDASDCETRAAELLDGLDAVVVPGGFGERGFDGKVAALTRTREQQTPTLGICLGLQAMVVEVARNRCGLEGASSAEFAPDAEHRVVDLMADQRAVTDVGGTMRLGDYPAQLADGSLVADLYGTTAVTERHRHRFEVNSAYRGVLQHCGLRCSGLSPDGRLVEFVELADHPFWVGTQAHPEFKSRPDAPHPLFVGLVAAALQARTSQP